MFDATNYRSFDTLVTPPASWSEAIEALLAMQLDKAESLKLLRDAALLADSVLRLGITTANLEEFMPPIVQPWEVGARQFHQLVWGCAHRGWELSRETKSFGCRLGEIADQADRDEENAERVQIIRRENADRLDLHKGLRPTDQVLSEREEGDQ